MHAGLAGVGRLHWAKVTVTEAALRSALAVMDDLDVVAVRIEREGRVVAGMVGALARRAVVAASAGKGCGVERLHRAAVRRLEGEVMAPGEHARGRFAVRSGDEQFVGPEKAVAGSAHGNAEHVEHGAVERLAGGQVAHDQLDVVDQAAAVQLHGFHAQAPCVGAQSPATR